MSETETIRIDAIAHGGEGVGTLPSGKRVFVPLTAPGDEVEIALVEERARFARGRLLRVFSPGPERKEMPCPHAPVCGGCQLQQISHRGQLAAKEANFYDALERLGGIPRADIPDARPILPSPEPFRYRIRARLQVRGGRLGYHQRGSHSLVAIETCHLLAPELEAHALRLGAHLGDRPIPHLAAVELCLGADGSVALALEPEVRAPRSWARGARDLLELPGVIGVVILGPRKGRHRPPPGLIGHPVVRREAPLAPGVDLLLRPDAFAQANAAANEVLVERAIEEVSPKEGEEVLELFSGNGNFSFALAARGARVSAVESDRVALDLARRALADAPFASRVDLVERDARAALEKFASEGRRFDRLLLDPPRAGAKEILPALLALSPERIVYVSCDPATLARDLRTLVEGGYRLRTAQPIDMFPQTFHLEGVVSLERSAVRG